ncbi:MAG TPA: type IX secretion system membrane protein PorP/SprF [Flavobacteriales bacterium]|nr:type IX secretion system membrane protein PorP/SprF [Flavobacteriales bacterium]HIO68043.1 type IX secretion system membrane protein PorP/SprF [Flavobacteriales bacterium]
MGAYNQMRYAISHTVKRFALGGSAVTVLLGLALNALAQQDAIYSQYMFNEVVVNPATAGLEDQASAVLLVKRQWENMPGAPMGQSFSMDGPLKDRVGIGLHFVADQFGPNRNTGVFGSVAYKLDIGKNKLALGFRGGIKSYTINWAEIEYASGRKGWVAYNHNTVAATMGLGARFYTENFYAGMVLNNLAEPSLNLQKEGIDQYGVLYQTVTLSAGHDFRLNDKMGLATSVLMKFGEYPVGDFRFNVNFLYLQKYWIGLGLTEAGGNILLGAKIGESVMVGLAFNGSPPDVGSSLGTSQELIFGYYMPSKKAGVKLHLVDENGSVLMIAENGKDGVFYFDKLPDQPSYLFKLESDDADLLNMTRAVEVSYKNPSGEVKVINVAKDRDQFFRYVPLPPIVIEELYALNADGDTVGVALKNAGGYFVFEYLPNDPELIFMQSDDIEDTDMLLTVLINDKETTLTKGEDKFFRFEELPIDVVTLYLLGPNGDTLSSGGLNEDGFFVFEKLPIDQSYIFVLEARDLDLIDEVQILQIDKNGKKAIKTLTKGDDKLFRYQYLDHQETRLYLIDDQGDTLMSTLRNSDGFFVFRELPLDQNILFMLDGEEVGMIDDILVLNKDKEGKETLITAVKQSDVLFRYESLPSNAASIPGMLEEDEVAFIMNTRDERILRTTYQSLKFNTGEAIIALDSYVYLEALSKMLMLNTDWRIILSGFTDDVGTDHYNLLLSKRRAETVKRALVKREVPVKQVRVKFYGESHPVAPNDTEEGRQKNRRVEMRIVKVKKD